MGLAALTACESQLTEMSTDSSISSALSQSAGSKITQWMGDVVEQQPSYPGGQQALLEFLRQNVNYPEQALKDSVEGRVVLSFVVETDGSITETKVVRSVHPLLDEEALRVAKLMPKWEPGYQNGIPVRVKYNIPVTFKLGEPSSLPSDKSKDN